MKNVDQDFFDFLSCSLYVWDIQTGRSRQELFDMAWSPYSSTYYSEGVLSDVSAAAEIIDSALSNLEEGQRLSFVERFRDTIHATNPDGTKKSLLKRCFAGTAFARPADPGARVDSFKARLVREQASVLARQLRQLQRAERDAAKRTQKMLKSLGY